MTGARRRAPTLRPSAPPLAYDLQMPSQRDYLQAISERVVVYDGGMGATLEQFDLTSEDYGGLRASATRRSCSTGRT